MLVFWKMIPINVSIQFQLHHSGNVLIRQQYEKPSTKVQKVVQNTFQNTFQNSFQKSVQKSVQKTFQKIVQRPSKRPSKRPFKIVSKRVFKRVPKVLKSNIVQRKECCVSRQLSLGNCKVLYLCRNGHGRKH